MFEEVFDATTEDAEEDSALAAGDLYKGKGVLSRDRWGFWKGRLGDFGEQNGDVRTVAREAIRLMDVIEQKKGV